MKRKTTFIVALAGLACAGLAFAESVRDEPIQPIPRAAYANSDLIELGKMLYFEPRLSMSGIISCNTCHNLSRGGTDNLKTSIGHKWTPGLMNAPTVLNSSLAVAQFWDGRAADLKTQAGGPIAASVEMAMPHTLAVEVLQSIPGYRLAFERVFASPDIDMEHITSAIAAFEETLVTPNSAFDYWLRGDDFALTEEEVAGYVLFRDSGCVACHYGPAVGGTSFQRMGVVEPYQTDSPAEGRIAVTGADADRFSFKVPTLRNVELTYPYFHDGAAATLAKAVDVMGRLQLGRAYTEDEISKIVAFLKTLTGDQPLVSLPALPPSADDTPRPDPFR